MAQPPEPPPEALLLRRKRIARGLSPAQAAELTGFSSSTYRQVENGYHVPAKGMYAEKIAPAETLARMLHAFGATPRELIDAGRADAAEILEGLIAEGQPAAAGDGRLPSAGDFARSMGVDPGDPANPFLRAVRQEIAEAITAHGAGATGAQVFHGRPGSDIEARIWDDPGLSQESKELGIATLRADRARYEAGRPGGSRSGTAGLARPSAASGP